MRVATALLGVMVAGLVACGASDDELTTGGVAELTAVPSFGSNPGALAMYEYVPADVPANAPLVVALHGCTQTAADYVKAGWNDLADQWKFYVVYAEQSSKNNQNSCFDFFDPNDASRGAGEALSIKQMVDAMKSRHSIDPARVYVTGLSAGGAMTAVMLATYPDVFAAGAIMAGLPYRCATSTGEAFTCMYSAVNKTPGQWGDLVRGASSSTTFPRVSIWQGTSDTTVRPVNADELVTQWTNVHAIDAQADATATVDGATHVEYKDGNGATQVERWTIPNMGHGTAVRPGWAPANGCGKAGAYILDAGICSTYWAGVFFGLGSAPVPPPPSDGGADVAPPPPPPFDAGAGDATSDAGFTCKTWSDTIWNHVKTGRAYRCGVGGSYACATGSAQNVGLWNMMPASLRETKPGYFEVGVCN
jgi:poly(hydroxyalkanoate) depolymerase family esterase